jgi:hypothetical protein
MCGLDNDTCDEVSLKLSGLIGVFNLMVHILSGARSSEQRMMLDFAYFISKELQCLYKTVSGIDYKE